VTNRLRWVVPGAIVALVVVLVWPAGAGHVALALVTATAVLLAAPAARSLAQRVPPLPDDDHEVGASRRRIPQKPNHLLAMERLAGVSGDPAETPMPFALAEQLRRHTRRRLADHHRLDLDRPADHATIARVLSPQLWYLVQPVPRDAAGRARTRRPLPSGWLPYLVAEVERL
jgi:hypothetical protein